jgi:hypothetical protein
MTNFKFGRKNTIINDTGSIGISGALGIQGTMGTEGIPTYMPYIPIQRTPTMYSKPKNNIFTYIMNLFK